MKEKLCIIDGDSLIYIHSWKLREDDDFYNHREAIREHIRQILSSTGCQQYIGYVKGSKSIRKTLAKTKEYKGNRKNSKRPKFYYEYYDFLVMELGFKFSDDGLEADDLCKIAWGELKDKYDITVATPDKDLKQFPTTFFNYVKNEFEVVDINKAKYNFWYQVLVGDSADNIPGLKGIGPVGAKKILLDPDKKGLHVVVYEAFLNQLGIRHGIEFFWENISLVHLFGVEEVTINSKDDIVKVNNNLDWDDI